MERIAILLDDGSGREFGKHLAGSLPEGGDLSIVSKDEGTVWGNPAVLISFTVELPNGERRRAQAVTTVRNFLGAAAALWGRYGNL